MKLNYKIGLNLFLIISIIYFLYNIVYIYTPILPVYNIIKNKIYNDFYINLDKLLFVKEKKVIKKVVKSINYLKDFKLKAIYKTGNSGFVLIKDKGKTVFIDLNQEYKGYKLIKINLTNVVFEKDNKQYILYLMNQKNLEKQTKINNNHINIKTTQTKTLENFKRITSLPRQAIKFYMLHMNKIWHNIHLIKDPFGYRITYINPNSVFYKLGLRKDDVLMEVNGRKLNNDKDAWDLYNNALKFNFYKIKIYRNNQERILTYEIK